MTLLPLWFKGLTPDLKEKAKTELGETSEVRTRALAEFRELIAAQKSLHSRMDDVFLLRFLRAKKFNVTRSLTTLINYYKFRTNVIKNAMPNDVKTLFDMQVINYLPRRTPEGCHVALFRVEPFDTKLATIENCISFIFMVAEMIFECEATQVAGGRMIFDCRGMAFQHCSMFLSIPLIKFSVQNFQDSFPERTKGIHFVHQSRAITSLYYLMKPFLTKKMLDRLHFHGNDLESLHKYIPKEILPEELGGTQGPNNNKEFASYFFSQENYIAKINKYGFVSK